MGLNFMKIQNKAVFPITAIFVTVLMLTTPQVFAENVSVSTPQGTSVPGCETTNECFIPYKVAINVDDTVTWSNDDSAAHTVTAGSAADGPSGVFDSSLFMAGTTFSHTFETKGEFPYFCMVHPWMEGTVIVGTAMEKQPKTPVTEKTGTVMGDTSKITLEHEIVGGKVTNVFADSESKSLIIGLETTSAGKITATLPRDVIDAKTGNTDDEFFILIDGEEVNFEETKTSTQRTVVINIPSGAEEIEIIGTFVIPEFGTITAMILAVAIISIIAVSAKSKLSIMPRL
jgi:predicted secreted protein with PEFG-CTERM motif